MTKPEDLRTLSMGELYRRARASGLIGEAERSLTAQQLINMLGGGVPTKIEPVETRSQFMRAINQDEIDELGNFGDEEEDDLTGHVLVDEKGEFLRELSQTQLDDLRALEDE
jgi:hypothetical protein